MSSRREMQQLVKELEKAGFSVTRTGSGHWMVRPPVGDGCVVLAFSPRMSNFHKTLKRLEGIGYRGKG
jgi:hypothetical protein